MNKMQEIRIEKLTFNIGAGKDQGKLNKGIALLKHITGIDPVKTKTQKRIAQWGLRPGLPIGCKVTLRKNTEDIIKRLLAAKENALAEQNFDEGGNVSFGIEEYIDIPGVKYEPEIGILGLQVCITLSRPGFRVKKRRLNKSKIGKNQLISKEDAINYFKQKFKTRVGEEQ